MGNFLETYARTFALPVRTGVRVERLSRQGNGFLVVAGAQRFEAENVIVAMSHYQRSRVPPFAGELAEDDVVQLHSADYVSPAQLRPGRVLVVGAGNSGAEIALELIANHETWLAGRDTGHVPFRDRWLGSPPGTRSAGAPCAVPPDPDRGDADPPVGAPEGPARRAGLLSASNRRAWPPPAFSARRVWSACGMACPCWRTAAC